MNKFLVKSELKNMKKRISFNKTVNHSVKPLKRIIKNIKTLGSSRAFLNKSHISELDLKKRQRRLKYGKWYLKPNEFSKSHRM